MDNPLAVSSYFRVMGYNQDGLSCFIQLVEDFLHLFPGGLIQGACRLIRQDELGFFHNCPCNRCPLLLPAG